MKKMNNERKIKENKKIKIELRFNYEDNHKKRSVQVKGLDL